MYDHMGDQCTVNLNLHSEFDSGSPLIHNGQYRMLRQQPHATVTHCNRPGALSGLCRHPQRHTAVSALRVWTDWLHRLTTRESHTPSIAVRHHHSQHRLPAPSLPASLSGTFTHLASLSGTFLQTLPELLMPLKGYSLSAQLATDAVSAMDLHMLVCRSMVSAL